MPIRFNKKSVIKSPAGKMIRDPPAGATTTPTRKTYHGLDEPTTSSTSGESRPATGLSVTVRPHRAAYGYFSSQRFGASG